MCHIIPIAHRTLEHQPLALYSRQLKSLPPVHDGLIEKELVKAAAARAKAEKGKEKERSKGKGHGAIDPKRPTPSEITAFCAANETYNESEVQKYLWRKRRFVATEMKVTKFVEAIWRFCFYAVFCIWGIKGLFYNPDTVVWIQDTAQNWKGWPFTGVDQQLPQFLKQYYQMALGCYIHQLMWTEVGRKDSTEMIIHHVSTIYLIMWSWCSNLTRIGCTILVVHDVADVFLESAKCVNYASLSKGRKWLSSICDSLFAVFAVTFAVSRLYYFPRHCVNSLFAEAPAAFENKYWIGYYIFLALLATLQVLHIFWFAMILKMVYGLLQKGEVEGDVRSDNEDEDESWTPDSTENKKGK